MNASEENIIYFIPSLVATLLNRERAKGSPLTKNEVIEIRDSAQCVVAPPDVAAKVDQERGYTDIEAENCWEEWQRVRVTLTKPRDDEE